MGPTRAWAQQGHQPGPGMRPAGHLNRLPTRPTLIEYPIIARESIGLNIPLVVDKALKRHLLTAGQGKLVGHQWSPSSVMGGVTPDAGFEGGSSVGVMGLHRKNRVVREQVPALQHLIHHLSVEWLEQFCPLNKPVRHHAMGEIDAQPPQVCGYPVSGLMIGKLAHGQVSHQAG